MKDLLARYGALLLLILIQVDLAGQITDTITLHWDTLPRPQKGVFTRYHQKADTIFGVYPEVLEVWQSTDQGQSWSLYQDSMQEFVATDSFIYYQKFGTQKYEARDNAGGVSVLAPVYTSTLLYQYNGESYYQVTAMRPLIGIDEHVVATFSTTRRDRCGTRCYTEMVAYRILRLSTNAGVDFQTFYLPITDADAYSTPQLALNGDSLAILDKGHLYLVPKNGLDMSAVSSVADSLFYFYQVTWIGNCLTVWGGDGSMYPQSQFPRKRSFDRGLTWTLDTLPVQMNKTQITTRDTFTFLAAPTGLYRSVNAHADSFVRIYTGLPGANSYVQSVLPRLPNIYANSSNNMLLHSNDGGQSWVLRPVPGIDDQMGIPFALDDKLNLINNFSWYQYSDDSAAWHVQPMQWPSIPDFPNPVLRLGGFLWIGGYKSNVFRSSDAGMSWQAISISPAVANQWVKLSITNNTLLADVGNTLWMSKDTGATWQVLEGNDIEPWQVIRLGDSIVCLNRWQPKYVFRTLDLGQTYQAILQTELVIVSLHRLSGGKLVAVLEDGTTYLSKDFGESWIQTAQPQPPTAYASYSTVVDSLLFYQHSAWNAPLLVSANGGVTYTAFHTPTNLAGLYKLNGYLYFVNYQHLSRTPFDSLHQVVLANNSKTGTLKGRIFFDNDMDCQLDSSDLPIAGKILEITPGPRFASTDPDGYFAVQLPIGTWAVKVPPLRHHTVCPDTLVANIVIPDDSVRTQDFGFQAVPNIYDGSVSLTPFTPVRPGFAVSYRIKVKNEGALPLQNEGVTCIFPAGKLVYVGANPVPAYQHGDTLRWPVDALPALTESSFTIDFTAGTTLPIGAEVKLSASLATNLPDAYPADNYAASIQITTGSFDPNDKSVSPIGNFPISERQMEYLIRFQNTGTDTAFQVRVLDTLDRDLDPLTLQMLDASHPHRLQLTEDHIIAWIFDPINLPDSNRNEAASHGFIRFSIRTKAGVLPYAKIPNSAAIYFDFNAPVLTSEVVNCLEKQVVWLDTAWHLPCAGDVWNFNGHPSTLLHDTAYVSRAYEDLLTIYNQYHQLTVHGYSTAQDTALYAGTFFAGQLVTPASDGTVRDIRHPADGNCDSIWRYTITVLPPSVATNAPESLDFLLFPNPTDAQVHLLLGSGIAGKNLVVSIVNTLGIVCKSFKLMDADHSLISLDLSDLPGSIYYVCVTMPGGQQAVRKLVLAK